MLVNRKNKYVYFFQKQVSSPSLRKPSSNHNTNNPTNKNATLTKADLALEVVKLQKQCDERDEEIQKLGLR